MARSSRGGRPAGSGRWVSVALFIALGLVGAFTVSFVAGTGRGGDAATGLAARDLAAVSEIRIEVLNGAGTSGLARAVTKQLRASGFDVVYFGNADRFDHDRSFVLDRVSRPDHARAVAAALGVDSVASEPDSTLFLDVTVVVGKDWPPERAEPTGLSDRFDALLGEN